MGFDYLNDPKYIRFPLWIIYLFPPEANESQISNIINHINLSKATDDIQCALIASHDEFNSRMPIYNSLKNILKICCPGKLKHNSNLLWEEFDDDKVKFLSHCKFNICPENTNCTGYVTEKLFEAFDSGSIPIYWGSNNNPEPGLINKRSIIFWNYGDGEAIKHIQLLANDKNAWEDFMLQEKFSRLAAEYIIERYSLLDSMIMKLWN